MKIVAIKPIVVKQQPWLVQRFGDHFAQISADTTLKLKSSVKDVARVVHNGEIPQEIEDLTKLFLMPPQGITDSDFVFGYKANDEWVPGSIESDPALQQYIQHFPREWEIVQKVLGIARQKTRHACLPARELILCSAKDGTAQEIGQWKDGTETETGTGTRASAKLIPQGEAEVWEFTTDTGLTIRLTPDHRVWTVQGWMTAEMALKSGAELVLSKLSEDTGTKSSTSASTSTVSP